MSTPPRDLLTIDLSKGTASRSPLDSELLDCWIGGRGLAVRLLRDQAAVAADSPETPVVLTTGPLAGSGIPGADRLILAGYSPLTGTIFTESIPGSMASALATLGVIALAITGTSPAPLSIRIEQGGSSLTPADHLISLSTSAILAGLPPARSTLSTGPAARSGSLLGGIRIDRNARISRGGFGRVLAQKGVVALQVGSRGESHGAAPSKSDDLLRLFRASPFLMGPFGLHHYGTLNLIDLIAERRMLPFANFRRTWQKDVPGFHAAAFLQATATSKHSCSGCPVGCHLVSNGEFLPGYTSVAAFAAILPHPLPQDILLLDQTCRELGIDPVSAAGVLGCAGELEGESCQPEVLVERLHLMASRTGVGSDLADGAQRFAQAQGKPQLAMTVKGLELPPFDPRGALGMALGYATSTKGGCYSQARALNHEILRKPVPTDRFSLAGKARMAVLTENLTAAADTLGICPHLLTAASLEEYAPLLAAITGRQRSPADLAELGGIIVTAERAANHRRGFRPDDDMLPERFFSEAGSGCDEFAVPAINKAAFTEALDDYRAIRGLARDGLPLVMERILDLP